MTDPPAREEPAAEPAGPVQAVVFVLAGDEYALPIGQVQEVINYTEPRSISSDVSWVRGVINLRGRPCRSANWRPGSGARVARARVALSSCRVTTGRPG